MKMALDDSVNMEVDEEAKGDKELSYEEKLRYVNKISSPMAPKKLTKKIYKLIKKGIY